MTQELIPDEKLSKALATLYNVWFTKWRGQAACMGEQAWQSAIDELDWILAQGRQYPVLEALGMALLRELEARARGYYITQEKKDMSQTALMAALAERKDRRI